MTYRAERALDDNRLTDYYKELLAKGCNLTEDEWQCCYIILAGDWWQVKNFAVNILKQNWCSKKQLASMRNIIAKTKPNFVKKPKGNSWLTGVDHDDIIDLQGHYGPFYMGD
jgi:hypothetical protein